MMCAVYSKNDFEDVCEKNGWNDSNVPENIAFISICCHPDCIQYVRFSDGDQHYFKEPHDNVLNIEFDDILEDSLEMGDSHKNAIGMTEADARVMHAFIKKHIGKDFMVHCRAGKSRSQGVFRYISDTYPGYEGRPDNPCLYPNIRVTNLLKRIDYEDNT